MSYHDPTGDLLAFRQFCLIADKIEADPGLLQIPLANITRWLGNGHWAARELAGLKRPNTARTVSADSWICCGMTAGRRGTGKGMILFREF